MISDWLAWGAAHSAILALVGSAVIALGKLTAALLNAFMETIISEAIAAEQGRSSQERVVS